MRFIKKLVILTGGYSKGTLMLEKNSFGVWGRLSLFDYAVKDKDRLVVLSGENMFVMRLSADMLNTTFELGELDLDAVHAAVVGERVELYGSNCATKFHPSVVMSKLQKEELRHKENEQKFVKFSGRECQYFKEIAPPPYNDFAIAEKNYFPAYLSATDEAVADEAVADEEPNLTLLNEGENKMEQDFKTKPMPHELEQKYLRLMQVAATIIDKSEQKSDESVSSKSEEETIVNITDDAPTPQPEEKVLIKDATEKVESQSSETLTAAKRMTLSDYKQDGSFRGRKATYFERSSEQLNKLLSTNERFMPIERLIPGSKFVKINYDGQRYYLVGVIGSDYICYGVPAMFSEIPPKPLGGYARWLPYDASNPKGEGFWMMYQDGVSGETLKS